MPEKNQENTTNKKILPSVAQNLGPKYGDGDGRETTGKERQRKGVANTRIWLNQDLLAELTFGQPFLVVVIVVLVPFAFAKNTGKQRLFLGQSNPM